MAVTRGKSPWIMTAAGDQLFDTSYPLPSTTNWNQSRSGHHMKVTYVRFLSKGGSGAFILLDAVGGQKVVESSAMSPNDVEEASLEHWVDNLYVSQIPTGGEVHVHYE